MLGYLGDEILPSCNKDYFYTRNKHPVINQPVFYGKYPSLFFPAVFSAVDASAIPHSHRLDV